MNGSIFLDTNVLVYAYDRSEPVKQGKAVDILDEISSLGAGSISTQILGELFVALTSKIRIPLSLKEGVQRIEQHLQIWPIVQITPMVILEALRGVSKHHFRYWDSLVWATARLNQKIIVLSEDFADGSKVEGVRFLNPFTPKFDIADWL